MKIIGWNYHVKDLHSVARSNFYNWILFGRPRSGPYYEAMSSSRREFKAAVKYVQNNQHKIKMDILAREHSKGNFMQFWKETKKLDSKISIPTNIEGEQDKKKIANLFRTHFNVEDSSNCVQNRSLNNSHMSGRGDSEVSNVVVTPSEVEKLIRSMKRGKSPGHDGLSIEHLLYAGQDIYIILARLFNICLRHSYLPSNMITTLVVPILKNKTGDVSSVGNYRPISLATILAKVLERIMQGRLTPNLKLDDAQFGFRSHLSTDMAIFSLKQVINYYKAGNTSVYACFLDLSRAFDTLSHNIMWRKLDRMRAPTEVVGLLRYWYQNQTNNIRWDRELSDSFRLSCGVRQGGVTSPDLFNAYVNDLIVELSSTPVGLRLDDRYVNNLSYADDMVLLSPSIKGLSKLIGICERYAKDHSLTYNTKKTQMVVFRAGRGPDRVPGVYLNGRPIEIVENFKYLGHVVTSSLKDDADIERQRRALCIVGNMIVRKFARSSYEVKKTLFKTFCQSFYTCQLWTNYTKKAIAGVRVAYNNIFRKLFGLEWCCSASGMFMEASVSSFDAIQRHRIAKFMSRVGKCKNSIIASLSDRLILTDTFKRWMELTS